MDYLKSSINGNKYYDVIKNRYFKDLEIIESWEDDYDEVWDAEAFLYDLSKKDKVLNNLIKTYN